MPAVLQLPACPSSISPREGTAVHRYCSMLGSLFDVFRSESVMIFLLCMIAAPVEGALPPSPPLLRGEGWGEGLLRPANAGNMLNAVPRPSPGSQRAIRPLPASGAR